MMTSSNGNIFRVTGHLCAGNSPVPGEFPAKDQWRGVLMFPLIRVWINGWENNREAGDLRRCRAHYDVTVMIFQCLARWWMIWLYAMPTSSQMVYIRKPHMHDMRKLMTVMECVRIVFQGNQSCNMTSGDRFNINIFNTSYHMISQTLAHVRFWVKCFIALKFGRRLSSCYFQILLDLMVIHYLLWQWRHNEYDGVSDHQCLLTRLIRRTSQKTSKLRVTGLCAGNSPVTGEFPVQRASKAENVFIWWRHHVKLKRVQDGWHLPLRLGESVFQLSAKQLHGRVRRIILHNRTTCFCISFRDRTGFGVVHGSEAFVLLKEILPTEVKKICDFIPTRPLISYRGKIQEYVV